MNNQKPSWRLLVCIIAVTITAAAAVIFVEETGRLAEERIAVEQFNMKQLITGPFCCQGC